MSGIIEKMIERYKQLDGYENGNYKDGFKECLITVLESAKEKRLLSLPCVVGDNLYKPTYDGEVAEYRVKKVIVDENDITFLCEFKVGAIAYEMSFKETDCGKTWFLSEKEARGTYYEKQ